MLRSMEVAGMTDQELLETQQRLQRQQGIEQPAPAPDAAEKVAGMIGMLAASAEAGAEKETEYLGEDGLLKCRICGGPRQTVVTPPFEGAQPRTVRCWCHCPTGEDARKERERRDEIEKNRRLCFNGTDMKSWSFTNDDGMRPDLTNAMKLYAEQFKQHLTDGKGLLLHGPVGTGKTFFAACVANAVIDLGYRARMANFEQIEKSLWDAEQKTQYMRDLLRYDLLVLDDLGTERKSEYMQEVVYNVIDGRYRAGLPVIITTNLTQAELTQTDEIGYGRIYDRILERCLPVKVDGQSRRRMGAGQSWREMRQQLGLEV